MNLIKRGAAILILLALILLFSGCIETPAADTQAPGAQVIPIPIPGSYIGAAQIKDTNLAANAIPYNVTYNSSRGTVTGVTFSPIKNNGSITVNRTSFVTVQWSGEIDIIGTAATAMSNSSYMIIQLGGVNMTPTPVIIATNGSDYTPNNATRTILVYNTSVAAGTYSVVPYINGSAATTVVTFGKNILVTMAYPHS